MLEIVADLLFENFRLFRWEFVNKWTRDVFIILFDFFVVGKLEEKEAWVVSFGVSALTIVLRLFLRIWVNMLLCIGHCLGTFLILSVHIICCWNLYLNLLYFFSSSWEICLTARAEPTPLRAPSCPPLRPSTPGTGRTARCPSKRTLTFQMWN